MKYFFLDSCFIIHYSNVMSHNIYNTEGIVLSSFGVGEANKFFNIFTRELGLVQATAQSVREIRSKNRYGLQDFSVSYFSLVRGKDIWRIINMDSKENLFFLFQEDREKLDSLIQIFSLLKQFIHGEEKNEELFDIVFSAIDFLKKNNVEKNNLENFDLIVKIRILHNLGYFDEGSQRKIFSDILKTNDFDIEIFNKIILVKKEAQREINNSIEDTHL